MRYHRGDPVSGTSPRHQSTMTSTAPQVSIIIPAYNVSNFIAETLKSVCAQTFTDWEAIVVNDGSADTPALEAAVQPFRNRITYLTQPNRGVGAARNTAIAQAQGEWLAFLDGDDYWASDYLERQLGVARARALDLIWCDALIVGDTGNTGKKMTDLSPCEGEVNLLRLLTGELTIPNSATVVRRSQVQAVGGIDESIRRGQDFELWVRLLNQGTAAGYQNLTLLRYRVREGNLTGDAVAILDREINVLQRIREKNYLAPDVLVALEQRVRSLHGDKALTLAKRSLAARDYPAALAGFRQALAVNPSAKLRAIVLLFPLVAPLVRRLFLARTPPDLR